MQNARVKSPFAQDLGSFVFYNPTSNKSTLKPPSQKAKAAGKREREGRRLGFSIINPFVEAGALPT